MAARYGFRVHSLELARGLRGRTRLLPQSCRTEKEQTRITQGEATEPVAKDYLDLLVEVLEDLRDSNEALTDVPKLIATADGSDEHVPSGDPGTPRLRVAELSVTNRRVSVLAEYGHLGYSHRALGRTRGQDAELNDRSPAEYFRIEFLVPDKGVAGIVATEHVARASVLPVLQRWINDEMRKRHGDDDLPRLLVPALSDMDRLNRVLASDAVAEIKLYKKTPTGDGLPDARELELTSKVRTSRARVNAKARVDAWVQRQRSQGNGYSEGERQHEVQLLAEIVDEHASEMGFTDGVVRLDEGSGTFVAVSPSRIGEILTYGIADHRPNKVLWNQRTRDQVMAMAQADGLSVAWD